MHMSPETRSGLIRGCLLIALLSSTPAVVLGAMFTATGSGNVFSSSDVGTVGETVTFSFSYDPASFESVDEYQQGLADYYALTPITVSSEGSSSGLFDIADLGYVYVNDSIDDVIDEFSFRTANTTNIDFYNVDATAFDGLPQSFEDLHSVFFDQLQNSSLWVNVGFFDLATVSDEILRLENTSISITETAVPLPPALWLMGSGLVALLGISKKKHSSTR